MRSLKPILIFALFAIVASIPIRAEPSIDALSERVFDLMADRLRLMPLVAVYKLHANKPIEDLAREAAVLEEAAAVAEKYGFDRERARDFFQVQIEAAKLVQRQTQIALSSSPVSQWPHAPSLAQEIRPELDRLSHEIMTALRDLKIARVELPRATYLNALTEFELPERLEDELFVALQILLTHKPSPDDSTLKAIAHSGTLKIGTTGDYAPFSFSKLDGDACKNQPLSSTERDEDTSESQKACAAWSNSLQGIDIALGESLANYLGFRLAWVPTSWPTLMQDLREHKFDIALSGISITPQRLAQAAFSAPYHEGGKTPLGHCSLKSRFESLADIDQKDTRVIVNPGGTNEQFIRRVLKRASITLHQDNRSIFDELAAQRADVMFTDQIEALLKIRQYPDLCLFVPHALTFQEKGVLIQPDSALVSKVNDWLTLDSTQSLLEGLWNTALDADY